MIVADFVKSGLKNIKNSLETNEEMIEETLQKIKSDIHSVTNIHIGLAVNACQSWHLGLFPIAFQKIPSVA